MKISKIHCDACGAVPALEVCYDFKRRTDEAGGSETDYKTVDLCQKHLQEALGKFLAQPNSVAAECGKVEFSIWAGWLKRQPKE